MKTIDTNLTNQAYGKLRDMMLHGELVAGSLLSVKQLSDRLGLGQMPVRSAVHRLKAEGFIKQVPRAGTVIATPTYATVRDMYQVRLAIEPRAAARVARHGDMKQIEKLNEICLHMLDCLPKLKSGEPLEERDIHHLAVLDYRFHTEVMRLAGNKLAAKIISNMQLFEKLYRSDASREAYVRWRSLLYGHYRTHKRIVRDMQRRDAPGAARSMRKHILGGRRVTISYFKLLEHRGDSSGSSFI